MYKYLVVDAALNGTGVRTDIDSLDIDLHDLEISDELRLRISSWLSNYHEHQFLGFEDAPAVEALDSEGLGIVSELRLVLPGVKVSYYSEALGKRLLA